jgi:hypothetical protein
MNITKSQIEDRKADLEQKREFVRVKAEADMNAFNGAIEDCDFWLQVIEKSDEIEATSKKEDEGLDKIPVSRPAKREG